jgi:Holliday junction resolvase
MKPEQAFLRRIVRLARQAGWRVFHPAPARFGKAWRTPYAGDRGFPDLVLVRPPKVLFIELKAHGRKPTPEQQEWLTALAQCSEVHTAVWRESEWGFIEKILAHDAP